jgi:sigma-B regulation protein RsbU (phosphoserine phosphatase)
METAGDFYDFIPLPNGRLGILVADVAGKGMGAALYMALSRTLIRTYAAEYDTRPDLVLSAVNDRILMDTRASLFVTVFYGILDPVSGTLTYSNAGHNPPYLLNANDGGVVQELRRTGIPLGIPEDMTWQQAAVPVAPGDVLVLYTDGITEAQDGQDRFFGEGRLLEIVRDSLGRSARDIQDALISEVHEFVGAAPQFDDITLMVVARDA